MAFAIATSGSYWGLSRSWGSCWDLGWDLGWGLSWDLGWDLGWRLSRSLGWQTVEHERVCRRPARAPGGDDLHRVEVTGMERHAVHVVGALPLPDVDHARQPRAQTAAR